MQNLFLAILFLSFLFSCDSQNKEITYYEDNATVHSVIITNKGRIINYKQFNQFGKYNYYFDSSEVSSELFYNKLGRNGIFKGFYRNGVISEKGLYKDGWEIGKWEYFNKNGKLKEIKIFKNKKLINIIKVNFLDKKKID